MLKYALLLCLTFCSIPIDANSYKPSYIDFSKPKIEKVGYKPYNKIVNEKEIKCLADNIYFEARSEKEIGKKAVALVTINRLKRDNDNEYPNSICGIVHQRNKYKCQFAWACDKRKPIREYDLYKNCHAIAKNVIMNYDIIHDVTKGATNFHRNDIKPNWAIKKKRTVIIGKHLFYRL